MSEPEHLRFEGFGGVTIAADRRGDPADPAVVFLHGGGQTRHSWGGTARLLAADGWCTYTLDLRGHGQSDWAPEGDYRLAAFADDVAAVIAALGTRPILVGASLGGLAALLLEGVRHPGSIEALVLVDVVPRMNQAGSQRIGDFMRENMESGFASLDEAADAIAAYNPLRPRPSDLDGLRKNLRERDGRWYWHWDPAFVSRSEGSPTLSEIHDTDLMMGAAHAVAVDLPNYSCGAARATWSPRGPGAREYVDEIGDVEYVDVSGAGHMVAGERAEIATTSSRRPCPTSWDATAPERATRPVGVDIADPASCTGPAPDLGGSIESRPTRRSAGGS